MDPGTWIIVLLLAMVAILGLELFIPSGGILAVVAACCAVGAIVIGFTIHVGLGLGLLLGVIVFTPVGLKLWLDYWPRVSKGKGLFLPDKRSVLPPSSVQLGDEGYAISEMRPWGECEFGDLRVESVSELGMIEAGSRVKVVAVNDGKPTVRLINSRTPA